jgi:hypothetical protein
MAGKSQVDKRKNRKRILFSFNVDLVTPIGVVFQYLMHNPQLPSRMGKQRGVEAMAAFWRPFAYQMKGEASEEELKVMARESMEALSRQIELIAKTFDVVPPRSSTEAISPALTEALEKTMDRVMQKYLGEGGLGMAAQQGLEPYTAVIDAAQLDPGQAPVHFDETEIFGEQFGTDEITT